MTTYTHKNIKDDKYFQQFITNREITEYTKRAYASIITAYANFTGKLPTMLIKEAEEEEENGIMLKKRQIKKYLKEYIKNLKDRQKTPGYIKLNISTINSFYREYDIETPKLRTRLKKQEQLLTTDNIVGKTHIKEILKHANIKYKAIILLMASSGMGRAEILNLTYKDFLNSIEEYYTPSQREQFDILHIKSKLKEHENLVLTWKIRRNKTEMPYVTFCTPETANAILDYLTWQLKANKPIQELDDKLFNLKIEAFNVYFQRLNDDCGFGTVGNQRFFTSHKLRKYFASTLHKNKIPELTIHWLLGHRIENITEAYFKADINALKNQYIEIIDDLSMESVILREVTTDGYDKLLKKLEALEKRQELYEKLNLDPEYHKKVSSMKKDI